MHPAGLLSRSSQYNDDGAYLDEPVVRSPSMHVMAAAAQAVARMHSLAASTASTGTFAHQASMAASHTPTGGAEGSGGNSKPTTPSGEPGAALVSSPSRARSGHHRYDRPKSIMARASQAAQLVAAEASQVAGAEGGGGAPKAADALQQQHHVGFQQPGEGDEGSAGLPAERSKRKTSQSGAAAAAAGAAAPADGPQAQGQQGADGAAPAPPPRVSRSGAPLPPSIKLPAGAPGDAPAAAATLPSGNASWTEVLLPKLELLNLSANQLQAVPTWLPPSLTHLNLSRNSIRELPAWLCTRLASLRHLALFSNQLESLPLDVTQLRQLEMLSLEHNPLTDPEAGAEEDSVDWAYEGIRQAKNARKKNMTLGGGAAQVLGEQSAQDAGPAPQQPLVSPRPATTALLQQRGAAPPTAAQPLLPGAEPSTISLMAGVA